jgi:hypothetical protein
MNVLSNFARHRAKGSRGSHESHARYHICSKFKDATS